MEMITRSFEIREVSKDDKTVTGIAVPWNTPTNVGGYTEQFERGAIDSVEGTKLFWNHAEVIGKVTSGRETDEGYEITARFSDTTHGRDAHVLAMDGVVDKFSVGFLPAEDRTEENGTVTRTKVHLKEVSLVPFPAYEGAQISEVRAESNNTSANLTKEDSNESTNMNENVNVYDDTELRSELDIVKRELAVVRDGGITTAAAGSHFRTGGEWLKALREGDENAKNEVRAYTGAVLADSHTSNDWKSDLLVIVNNGRPVLDLFDKAPLGSRGNNVEFPRVKATSGDVAVQANEGDDLPYIELQVETATVPVKTYGGYSALSRQAIERSDVDYLGDVLKLQAASYAKVTNAAVRTALTSATPQTGTSLTLSSATAADFLGAVIDGVAKIEANGKGAQADFILVSLDVFSKIAATGSTGFAFDVNGSGGRTIGTSNIKNLAGSLAGFPIVVDAGLPAKSLYVASKQAITTWENAGAPVRLTDENIINLTELFSLYGYLATGVKNANGLVKASVA